MSRIGDLRDAGVAVWIDMLSRDVLDTGEFERWIREDGITGATSNPTIFAEALAAPSNRYDDQLRRLVGQGCADPRELFLSLAITDVGSAADLLLAVYEASNGTDGFVSIECTPDLADDTEATVSQALDIWSRLDRPNVMVKVPATEAGVPAVAELISRGVNVNITLLFSQERYGQVIDAFVGGLQRRKEEGGDVAHVRSVASFFVSRIDTKADSQLPEGSALRGRVAVANAKLAYQMFRARFAEEPWPDLAQFGAQPQRLLWASTGTKNPAYSDVLYVEELIGPDVVNTMPPKTRSAFADHGKVERTLDQGVEQAREVLTLLADYGVDLATVTAELEHEGVASFCASYRDLLSTIARKIEPLTAQQTSRALS